MVNSRTSSILSLRRTSSRRVLKSRVRRPAISLRLRPVRFGHLCSMPKKAVSCCTIGVPDGIRTRVTAVKGRCPRPLDDGDAEGITRVGGHLSI